MPTLKKQTFGIIVGLSVQFVLGMLTTSFVKFPESGTEKMMWDFVQSQFLVEAHILVGLTLLLNSVFLLLRSFKQKDRIWKLASIIGFLSIIAASSSGSMFVSTQEEIYSFIMAMAFLVALLTYFWAFHKAK